MKKKNIKLWIVGIILVVSIIFFIFKKDIWDVNADKLKDSLRSISENTVIDDLSQWTPFEWDTLYSFAPYTSTLKIYEVVGYRWDLIMETVNEGMNQIVFMKDNKVVCYLYGYPIDSGIGFQFEQYEDGYFKLSKEENMSFQVTITEEGIRYLKYMNQ